ncbi:aldo/keto reductase [Nonomuraea sp. NPDC050404]|uniref:aldo/keto reductase n=1 Tax=Nonomuraea sp. NPDC050404 TaxID=3155783 RepID=UPI003407D70A
MEAGINFFDTADVYGGPQSPDMAKGYGVSEDIIGRWLAQDPGRHDRIVLATKAYLPMETGPNDRRQRPAPTTGACRPTTSAAPAVPVYICSLASPGVRVVTPIKGERSTHARPVRGQAVRT